jgi:glycosyltransferase involved in cell wall biosynthesis
MRTLHVIARMNVGGTARYVGRLVAHDPDALLATGYVQGAEKEDDITQRVKMVRVPHMGRKISPLNDIRAYFELWKIVKEFKPEIIHSHTFKAGLLARLVPGKFARVHTFHGHLFEDQSFSAFDKFLITWAERFLAGRSDVLISVGKRVGDELRAMGVGRRKKWISIPPGVDPLAKMDKGEARKILGLPHDGVMVGWMARVTSVKNPFLASEVASQLPDTLFVIAGGGDLLSAVSASAPSNVKVIGWADASAMWSAMDVVLSTSDNEGMPIALIEAQLASLPVVATDVGSNEEVIENGYTGFVVAKDRDLLVTALMQLINDRRLREGMGASARERASQHFSVDGMLSAHDELYESLRRA